MTNRRQQLIKYVLPSLLSSVSIFLFTIIDGIFVGRGVGANGLGAVNLAFPYVMVFTALVMLTTVGGLTITAIRFGRGDKEGAGEAFNLSVRASLLVCILLCAVGVFLTEAVARLMGANDAFLPLTCDYLFWYSVFLVPCGMNTCFCGFCRNDGAPRLVSISTIFCTALNIFGDWLLIFPLDMGLKGAAIATGVAQTVGFFILLPHFLLKKGNLHFRRIRFKFDLLKKILLRGLPECIAQFSVPLSTIFTNVVIIRTLGNDAENAYSLICYAACFSAAVFVGVSEGVQPLFGLSYGGGKDKDLRWYLRSGLWIVGVGSSLLSLMIILLWPQICLLFGVDEATKLLSTASLPYYSWGFTMQSFNVVISAFLYSTTHTKEALAINISRSFIVNSAVIFLLPAVFGEKAIWLTFGVYEAIVLVLAVFLLRKVKQKGIIRQAE